MRIEVKYLKPVMDKLFQAVGIQEWDTELTKQENWFQSKSWTWEDEIEFKNWLVGYLIKSLKMHPKIAESTANWFVFEYGWKIEEVF